MSQTPDNSHHVRRVVLPSGRQIEVVYFDGRPAPGQFPAPSVDEIHVCPACEGALVYPIAWDEAEDGRWEVTLRCPDCEWRRTGVWPQEVVDRFDEQLDRGTATLVADLKRLTRANMEEETDRFVRALRAGAILPEDF